MSGVTHGLVQNLQSLRMLVGQPQSFRFRDLFHGCNPVVRIPVCTPDEHWEAKHFGECPDVNTGAMMDGIEHVRHFHYCRQFAPEHCQAFWHLNR